MAIHFCKSSLAVLLLGGGAFPPKDELDWENTPNAPDPIEIAEWQDAFLRFYGELPLQFTEYLPEAGQTSGGSRFIKLPHHALPTYCINFKNYVGYSVLAGFRIKVTNRKITEAQFNAMLNFLCDEYAALIFSFRQIAGINWRKDKAGKDSLYLQYLLLRRHLLHASPNLDGIATLVHRDMHERFALTVVETPIERVWEIDSSALINLFSRAAAWGELEADNPLGATPWVRDIHNRTGRRMFPVSVQSGRRHSTVDTPENRFVKFFLEFLERRLAAIKSLPTGTFLHPELGEDIERIEKSLDRFQGEPRWSEVGELRNTPTQSTVLHRRAGYRELFRLYSLLQLVSRHDPLLNFAALVDIKDVPLMYEYWCFFQIKRLLDQQFGAPSACHSLHYEYNGERKLQEGLKVDYRNGISLYYNPCCPSGSSAELTSYSHDFYPDILLTWQGRKLVLDAKYKGFYSNEQTIDRPKDEDIDKMHCYREAIRDVWGAFALYPGEKSQLYQAFDAMDHSEGVGALALRPSAGDQTAAEGESNVSEVIRGFFASCGSGDQAKDCMDLPWGHASQPSSKSALAERE